MKKLFFLLSFFFLTACASPKVSNITHKYVENNPANHQTVKKKNAIKKNKPKTTYDWQGSQSNIIDEIIVRQIDEYTVNEYTYDMASGKYKFKDVKKKVTEHKYRYETTLELLETSTYERYKN